MNKLVNKAGYLLGIKDGESFYLEKATWDCDWYWGFGYVESYRGKGTSDRAWRGHQHFDTLFLKPAKFVEGFKASFDETPLSDKEIWKLLELMKSFYIARQYSDMLHTGGAHISSSPVKDTISSEAEYKRINEVVIPAICEQVYKLLSEEEEVNEDEEV